MKEWNKKITEPAQISLVFHFINKLHLNIALNITHSNVHEEFVLRVKITYDKSQLYQATWFWKLLKYYIDQIYIKELRWSELTKSSTAHRILLLLTKSSVSSKTVPVDLGRATEYLHDLHLDDCLTVIRPINIKFHLKISPCPHVLYRWMHKLNFQLLITPPPPALPVTWKMQVKL